MWTTPRTWVAGELVTAALLNVHLRDNLRALGQWAAGDLKMSYLTHGNVTAATLTEPQTGWYIANGAGFAQSLHPNLYAALGSVATLPDLRGRTVVMPGTQDSHAFARGEVGGEYDHALSTAELAAHTHGSGALTVTGTPGITDPGHVHAMTAALVSSGATPPNEVGGPQNANRVSAVNSATTGISATAGSLDVGGSTDSNGSGTQHPNMPPYLVAGMILIKNDT